MLIIDSREDLSPFDFRPFDIDITVAELSSADYSFLGYGPPDDQSILIGVERKKIRDLVNSMRDRRLSGFQAPNMAETYDRCYLIVEGIWGVDRTGALEELSGREWRPVAGSKRQPVLWREVDSFLSSLEEFFGLRVFYSRNKFQTVAWLVSRYKYWQKPYSKHRTHKQVYAPAPSGSSSGKKLRFVSLEKQIRGELGEAGVLAWKWAAQIDGIDSKAEAVAREFKNGHNMAVATESDWRKIKGIGKEISREAVRVIGGEVR